MKCRICRRSAVNTYCELHKEMYEKIIEKYENWKKAKEISWIDYLKELVRNDYTGSWIKEVANQLLLDVKE